MKTEWLGRNKEKEALRKKVWTYLSENNLVYTNPFNEIPDYIGREQAAAQLMSSNIWKRSNVIKCNPDNAQLPLRIAAVKEGKTLYMAVPQLVDENCFFKFSQEIIEAQNWKIEDALRWDFALENALKVSFKEMQAIDLVIVGCVAASLDGVRIGKGGGFADIELGLLRYYHLINEKTPIGTTIHDSMLLDKGLIPHQTHDSLLNIIATPTKVYQTEVEQKQPTGINWDELLQDQLEDIPILKIVKKEIQESNHGQL